MPERATSSTDPTGDPAAGSTTATANRRSDRRVAPGAERIGLRDHLIGASWSLGVALAWAALAVWRPTTTFHLAPVLVAAAWPVGLRRGAVVRVASRDATVGAVAAAVLGLGAGVLLDLADLFRGPTLWGSGSVWWEVLPAVAVGAWGGRRFARCGAPGG